MFHCSEVSQKLSQVLDMHLPPHHRMAIRIHLMMCRYCARFRRQLLLIRKMCRYTEGGAQDIIAPDALTPQARKRIKAALRPLLWASPPFRFSFFRRGGSFDPFPHLFIKPIVVLSPGPVL
jgi:hypothetical protein